MAELDPTGAGLAMISIGIVFSVLLTLFLVFKFIGKTFQGNFKMNKSKKTEVVLEVLNTDNKPSGEVCAAIAMAIYHYNAQNHDYENTVITIKKNVSDYSPWNSKIYGLRKSV